MDGAAANLRRFYVGMLAGDVAYEIQGVAIAWYVFTLRHRAFDLGLVGLALFLPAALFALPAGIVSDRLDRRAIVATTLTLEAIAVAGFVAAVASHVRSLPLYLAILAIVGTARAFGVPSERAILPGIVGSDRFVRVQASYASLREGIRLAGPVVGGLLVAASTQLALGASCVALAFSALVLASLDVRRVPAERPPTLRDAFEGLRFLRSEPIVAGAISLDLFAVLFGGATALLPAFADGVFHLGPQGLGLLRSAPGVGAAIAAVVLARRPLERRVGATLFATVAIFGLATIVFGLSKNFALSLVALAIVGASDMVSVVIRVALVGLATPDAMRGRVNAVENVFIGASNELGAFESGTLAGFVGVVPAVVIGGLGTLAVIALWSAAFPALRRADRFASAET